MNRSTNSCWADYVQVGPRYRRSVHLERDAFEAGALDGYVLTPLVRTLVGRVVEGFQAATPSRAWSITGPYGTGKSAFALFLSQALASPNVDSARSARQQIARVDPGLADAIGGATGAFGRSGGLLPVVATGERRSLDATLLRALHAALTRFWGSRGKKPSLLTRLEVLVRRSEHGHSASVRDTVGIFEEASRAVAKSSHQGQGLLVVLDEAGKALEHAAQEAGSGDVQLLQELAEAANRSGDCPIVFVVLLHQAFEQYAGRLSLTERSEWAKVQGRFEDLPFQESSNELLHLVGEALELRKLPTTATQGIHGATQRLLPHIPRSHQEKGLDALLRAAAPLHPAAALILGPLFRSRIAQNERSLFAFLSSSEPKGFQQFLAAPLLEQKAVRLFDIAALYDYVSASLGGRLHGHLGREWVQVETALRRLPAGAVELDAALIKTIGLLGIFGDAAGISASSEVLQVVFEGRSGLDEALTRLKKASLIIFRKYRGAFQLYEGSDLDVEALVRDALSQIDVRSNLIARLERVAPPRPIVARRHLFETGTLRFFDLRYVDSSAFDEGIPEGDAQADGTLLLVLEPEPAIRKSLVSELRQRIRWLTLAGDAKPVLVAIPLHVGRLLELAAELAALEWVQTHTPELHDDLVARREVQGRLTECERQLRDEVARILTGEVPTAWTHQGEAVEVRGGHEIARLVSDMCDAAYHSAPAIQNELINRRHLSSAAAAARRSLLEAMVEKPDQIRLGFEGTPPEVSMYRSLLEKHKLHREQDGRLGFHAPRENKRTGAMWAAWNALDNLLLEAQEQRLKLTTVYERLRRPPFGLKDGILPVLLVTDLLVRKDELALYEDGAFVPHLTGAVVERLLRQPDRFEAQRLTIAGPRAALYGKLAQALVADGAPKSPGIVPLVRALVRVVRDLTSYARTTKSIGAHAQAVREALLRAREPAPLLFQDLPEALGFEPFLPKGKPAPKQSEDFVEALRGAVREIQQSYPLLLAQIEEAVQTGLSLPLDSPQLRTELSLRTQRLMPAVVEAPLKAFMLRAGDEDLPREEWLISVGTLLVGKPPEAWHDRDLDQMRLSLGQLCRRFATLETIVLASDTGTGGGLPMLRLAVAQQGEPERERVVPLRPADRKLVESVRAQLRQVADSARASLPSEAIVAALGLVARDMLAELDAGRSAQGELGA